LRFESPARHETLARQTQTLPTVRATRTTEGERRRRKPNTVTLASTTAGENPGRAEMPHVKPAGPSSEGRCEASPADRPREAGIWRWYLSMPLTAIWAAPSCPRTVKIDTDTVWDTQPLQRMKGRFCILAPSPSHALPRARAEAAPGAKLAENYPTPPGLQVQNFKPTLNLHINFQRSQLQSVRLYT